jgi:uncharacterized membrane protein
LATHFEEAIMAAKIPKRIAGVKVKKQLRKRGNELLALADTPQGRETIATGLTMAAAAASIALRKHRDPAPEAATPEPKPAAPTPAEPVAEPTPTATDAPTSQTAPLDPDKIVAAVGQTIEAAMTRFMGNLGKR